MSQQLFAFVLMPFANELEDKYVLGIKSAAEDAGMRVERLKDQVFYRQGMVERIHHQIEEADFIIGDMTEPNTNVFYEVGYALGKKKLCILLTDDPEKLPFDLKDRRHIVYFSIQDLKKKLTSELRSLKGQTDLSFNKADPECIRQVPVFIQAVVGQSQATSIRLKVEVSSELQPQNVTAFITKMEKYSSDRVWVECKSPESVQLTWADTDTIVTDFLNLTVKYLNVLHIDHNENKITIWRMPMPQSLVEFFNDVTKYRLTVSVMGRQSQIEIDWKGRWDTIRVGQAT
jgi:hypothetical protein